MGRRYQIRNWSGSDQGFWDLLRAGIKASTHTAIEKQPNQITVRTSVIDAQWVEIAIADNGPGIPEAVQKRILDP